VFKILISVSSSSSATADGTKNKGIIEYTIHVRHLEFLDIDPVSNEAVPCGNGAFAEVYRVLHKEKLGLNELAFKKLSVNYIGGFSKKDQKFVV